MAFPFYSLWIETLFTTAATHDPQYATLHVHVLLTRFNALLIEERMQQSAFT
jgi:hypothetical protein